MYELFLITSFGAAPVIKDIYAVEKSLFFIGLKMFPGSANKGTFFIFCVSIRRSPDTTVDPLATIILLVLLVLAVVILHIKPETITVRSNTPINTYGLLSFFMM